MERLKSGCCTEWIIDLLKRVCTVRVETVRIVNQLVELANIQPAQDQQSEPELVALSQSAQNNPVKNSHHAVTTPTAV